MPYYNLDDYRYNLPQELIAQEPLNPRDSSRMLLVNRDEKSINNSIFKMLPHSLNNRDILVMNNTKVIPARLIGSIKEGGKKVEILLLQKLTEDSWKAMVRPGKKLKPGGKIHFDHGVTGLIEDYAEEGLRIIKFSSDKPFSEVLNLIGNVPLPPYITKKIDHPDQYQTIYAEVDGSAAAPTAGFHFTESILAELKQKKVKIAYLTLHVGPGTFQPVKTDDIRDHSMHREYYQISEETAEILNMTRKKGGRIVAVGTTACRVLETIVDEQGIFHPSEGLTDLFIYPGFRFRAVDALLTNFHLPRSSLLMLVCAFGGYELIMEAYTKAVSDNYRFFSFGDCMFIL